MKLDGMVKWNQILYALLLLTSFPEYNVFKIHVLELHSFLGLNDILLNGHTASIKGHLDVSLLS